MATLKVFLSSTARDLGPYRDAVYRAIQRCDDCTCVRMEDFGARDQVPDALCREKVAGCGVLVGLIGGLYGSSPPGLLTSFTEREYEAAVAAGIPRLMFLSSEDFPLPRSLREPDELNERLERFRQRVQEEETVDFFDGNPDALATRVVAALRNLEKRKTRKPKSTRRPPAADLGQVRERYLAHLVERYRYLDFKGFGVSDRIPIRLPLLEMYVPLKARLETPEGETWERLVLAGRKPTEDEADAMGRKLSEPRPVLDLLQSHDGLILLGDPGSGKTTFLKYLALTQAQGEALGLGDRLPVLLPLSAYANALAEKDVPLGRFLPSYHQEHRGLDLPLDALLGRELPRGGVLFLLDGLDEVRDQGLRNTVVERVRDFYGLHRKQGNKFVLTSRIVGYREVRPAAEGLAEGTLVDFDDEEIRAFVAKWTSALERAAVGDTKKAALDAQHEQEELLAAVRNPGVRSLAANPLLLTILALMKRQGVTLPDRRVELYQTYVETLLRSWNLVRSLEGRAARDLDLVETLKILAPLALWMHRTSPGVGLVKEWDLHQELERIYRERGEQDPERATRHFLEDVRGHAALLLDRGGRQYGFIHLTFQEYLAAVALAQLGQQRVGPVVEALAGHVDEAPWHEVILLTIGYLGIGQRRDEAASAVVQSLLDQAPGTPGQAAVLAGRAVADAGPGGVTPACRQGVVDALLHTMRSNKDVAPVRRAQAGEALSRLGDPRFAPEAWYLPKEPLLGFVYVPAGSFRMGDEDKEHEVELPDYYLARFPVTVQQFRMFVEQSSYAADPYSLDGPSACPVTSVSWHHALAYCGWLEERLREAAAARKKSPAEDRGFWEGLASGRLRVTLPSEAEWEKAARGADGRIYPWGEEPDTDRANFAETGIGTPSPVGCFLTGASPYGCEEMSGNVFEWTRSLEGPYPYPVRPKERARREALSEDGLRVVRGGSCFCDPWLARCAFRYWFEPGYRLGDIGFRVVVLPFRSGL